VPLKRKVQRPQTRTQALDEGLADGLWDLSEALCVQALARGAG